MLRTSDRIAREARTRACDRRPRRLGGPRPGLGLRRRRARRARGGCHDGRRGSRHAPERPAEGLHGRAQRRALDARARGEGHATTPSSGRASIRSSRSSSAASPSSTATTRVGAVGVSGLPGEVDEQLALRAIDAGLALELTARRSSPTRAAPRAHAPGRRASSRPSSSSPSPRIASLRFSSSSR